MQLFCFVANSAFSRHPYIVKKNPQKFVRSFPTELTCNQNQLLSALLAIQTFAINLIYYQLSCYHIHLRSSLIFYLALTAIDTFANKAHLLSGQFAINPQLQSTILLSIIICYQIFDFLSILIFTIFFLLKV